MKNFIWILAIIFLFTQCANENSNNEKVESTTTETTITAETSSEPDHYKASADAPYVGFWVIEFAIGNPSGNKEEVSNEFVGRWCDLKADNTFESGKWEEQNNTGTWSFDPNTNYIFLKYDKAETIAHEWRIQGQGDRMVWIGNTPSNVKGTQLKLNRETARPRQQ